MALKNFISEIWWLKISVRFMAFIIILLFYMCPYVAAEPSNSSNYERLFEGKNTQEMGVKIHTDGRFSVDGKYVDMDDIEGAVRNRVNRDGPKFTFYIDPEPGAVFSNAWPVIAAVVGKGVWQQGVLVDGIKYAYTVPARDKHVCKPGFVRTKSPIILKNFAGNEFPSEGGISCIRLIADKVFLNKKRCEIDKLKEHLKERSKDKIVILIPSSSVSMKLFSETVKMIITEGNNSIAVTKEVKD